MQQSSVPNPASEFSLSSVPDEAACYALHQRYAMMPHIHDHCVMVAAFARQLAERAVALGVSDALCVPLTVAAGLLHDIAKTYCIRHGGSHAQMGASWVIDETGNYLLAQAVLYHVEWTRPLPDNLCHPVFFVNYADKRIRHDTCVTLTERYDDLMVRYGSTERSRESIRSGQRHGLTLERALAAQLELPLHACTLAGGRLVS